MERIQDLDESVKKSLTTTLSTEARINLAKEDDKSKVQQLLKAQPYLPNYVFHQRFVNTPIFRKILVRKFEKISYFW